MKETLTATDLLCIKDVRDTLENIAPYWRKKMFSAFLILNTHMARRWGANWMNDPMYEGRYLASDLEKIMDGRLVPDEDGSLKRK